MSSKRHNTLKLWLYMMCTLALGSCREEGEPETVQPTDTHSDASTTQIIFEAETVTATVLDDGTAVLVQGEYEFLNDHDVEKWESILFPFSVDSTHPGPEPNDIEVENITFGQFEDSIIFDLHLPANSRKTLRISYRQSALDNTFTYIVRSAIPWQRPLKSATFELRLPDGFQLVDATFPLEAQSTVENGKTYRFQEQGFVPDVDFTFSWKRQADDLVVQ
jgi:hypothetical protein